MVSKEVYAIPTLHWCIICISLLHYLLSLSRAKRELFGMDVLHVALTDVKLEHVSVSLIYWY